MLKYEEKLHLDKHYKHLQAATAPIKLGSLISGILGFTALYLLFSYLQSLVPFLQPLSSAGQDICFCVLGMPFSRLDCVYFAIGLIGYCLEYMRLQDIIRQNHSVRAEGNYSPDRLLTTGCYTKVRHPMYGAFMLLQSSLLLSLRSLVGIVLALIICVFQYFNATFEEKRTLRPLFKAEYESYESAVPAMLLRRAEMIILITAFATAALVELLYR